MLYQKYYLDSSKLSFEYKTTINKKKKSNLLKFFVLISLGML